MSKFLDKTGLDTFWAKIKSTFQTLGNLVTSWGSTPSDTKYPSEKLVKTALDGKVDKVSDKGLSTNDYTTTEKNKLAGIASGAEVNVQSDWNQTTTTADDYIKNKPTIPSGTQLVYDCGTGSTSGTDFDNALAAYQAGKWVILHYSSNPYYCVGTYNSGLRFKRLANESSLIKIDTVNWTRGSAPSAATQLEAALVGHTHPNYVPTSRTINGKELTENITLSASDVGAVTDVAWDTTNKKITKTINGTTSDVVTPGVMLDSFEDSNEYLAGTGIFIAANPQSAWKKYPISRLWSWIQQSIGSVLGLYIDNTTQQKRFSGIASSAVTATNATNANLSHSYNSSTAEGESVLQIGNGTAQSCVRSANTYKVYGWGTSSSGYANTYWELGSNTSRPTLTISYTGTGSAYHMRLTESSLKFSIGSDTSTVYLEAYDGLVYQYSGSNAQTNYSGSNWTFVNPGSQFSVTASRDSEKIEISKSGATTIITGPAINTPQMELYGSTRSLALVNNTDNDRIRVCQASNNANLYDLQARKFYGPLKGNVTGNADTATKATQDGDGNNIVDTYAPLSSVLRIGNDDGAGSKSYNLDTFTARGIHFLNINQSTSTNAPGNGYYTIIVTANKLGNRIWQVALGYYVRVRRYTGSAWTAWQTIATLS